MNAQPESFNTARPIGPAFVSGYGQSDTHAAILNDGRPNPHKSAGTPYSTITAREIVAMVQTPPSVPKERARWFIPSAYHGSNARTQEVQRERGLFHWLTLDVDDNDLSLAEVNEAVEAVTGPAARLTFSSRSATPDRRKWRALVPLLAPLGGADFTDAQHAFYDGLERESAGVLVPDRRLALPAQLVYLPNRGEFYEHQIVKADRLDLTEDHPIMRCMAENRAARAQAEAEAQARRQYRIATRPAPSGDDVRPVDHFNASHSVGDLLVRYGYRQLGHSPDWRSPMQTSGSYATRDCGDYWVSLSASDAAAGIGAVSANGNRHGDAFDLFVHFEHGGDFNAAVAAYAQEAGLNRRPDTRSTASKAQNASDEGVSAPDLGDDPVDLWGTFPAPDIPTGLLPVEIETFARVQGEMMGADPAGLAVAALVTCAAAINDNIKLQVKRHDPTWTESARIWAALVGSPSTKKSPILSAATAPLCRIDRQMFRDWQAAMKEFQALPKEEKYGKNPPPQTRLRIEDATVEAAQLVLEGSPWGVLLLQDELSGFFGAMDRYNGGKGAGADRAFWLRAFNGGEFALNRVGRGSSLIPNLSLCLLGGIQPEPIRRVVADAHDDGLLQRLFPVVLKPATIGQDAPAPPVVAIYGDLVDKLHKTRPPGFAGLGVLAFDEGAQDVRRDLEAQHLTLQASEAVNRKLASHIGKYDGLFARLCIIWHCIENRERELPHTVTEDTARRAGDFLHKFLLPHAVAFYGGVLGLSDDHDRLQAIAGYILAHKLDRITNRDVQRGDRTMRAIREADIRPLLEQLAALGWLDRIDGPRPSSQPHWIVNPAVHRRFTDRAEQEAARRAEARQAIAGVLRGGDE